MEKNSDKTYKCVLCSELISKGERYVYINHKIIEYRAHLTCDDIREITCGEVDSNFQINKMYWDNLKESYPNLFKI
jgi:hypothetical protein